jgi:hypothetical protein
MMWQQWRIRRPFQRDQQRPWFGPRNAQAEAMAASGVDKYDIPAFLRRQSD